MRRRVSRSAQRVLLVRAVLTEWGAVDDAYAGALLPRWRARLVPLSARVLRAGRFRLRTPAYLADRTNFYDRAVAEAIDDGITQVVILGAGFDTRAQRFAQAQVRFFEVDLEATQAAKRSLIPSVARYVAHDLRDPGLPTALRECGWSGTTPTLFLAEGALLYLPEHAVGLLATLRRDSATGSRLTLNAGRRLGRPSRISKRSSEPQRWHADPVTVSQLLAATGWRVRRLETGRDWADRLAGSGLWCGGLRTDDLVFLSCGTSAWPSPR